jgi:hypothetical protein
MEVFDNIFINLQIDGSRHSGGNDLVFRFNGHDHLIAGDFPAGDKISLTLKFNPGLSMKQFGRALGEALIFSNYKEAETWRCDWVEVGGRSSTGRDFYWRTETSRESRNSKRAGPDDNPLTFADFDFGWDTPRDWMRNNLDFLGAMTLKEVCMPGAHDAGMFKSHSGTFGAHHCNTQTQTKTFYEMLCLGVRYFDIRPIIGGGAYYTGHYGHTDLLSWQGARGASIEELVSDVNRFTATCNELIILHLTHDLKTDHPTLHDNYKAFTQDEYDNLLISLESLNYRFGWRNADNTTPNLVNLKIQNFITNSAAVIVLVEPNSQDITINERFLYHGFYRARCYSENRSGYSDSSYTYLNNYSDTSELGNMVPDQFDKLTSSYSDADKKDFLFMMSWTLTQSKDDASMCFLPLMPGRSILQLAGAANETLDYFMRDRCHVGYYPSILFIDRVETPLAATLSMWFNAGFPK